MAPTTRRAAPCRFRRRAAHVSLAHDIALFALIVTLGIGLTASAAPGDLDPTFGVGGRVTLRGLEVGSPDYSMIQQMDGKLVVTGGAYVGNDVRQFLVRLELNGMVDAGFATDGVFISEISSSNGAAVLQ